MFHNSRRRLAILLIAFAALAPVATHAASTTSRGEISVAQVMEMAGLAKSDPAALQTLIAYLAGIGETTGIIVSQADRRGMSSLRCTRSFTLDGSVAVAALTSAAPDQVKWVETAATPIIIADLFARGGCR